MTRRYFPGERLAGGRVAGGRASYMDRPILTVAYIVFARDASSKHAPTMGGRVGGDMDRSLSPAFEGTFGFSQAFAGVVETPGFCVVDDRDRCESEY